MSGDLPPEDMERMARLADMCVDVLKEAYEAYLAAIERVRQEDDDTYARGETPEHRDLPSLRDDIRRREDEAYEKGGFDAFMSGLGRLLLQKHPTTRMVAPFKPVGAGAMPARLILP